jgi:Protein of unknown function (DUF2793)
VTDDRSGRLALPFLYPSQAQKEMFHNEALALLDVAVQAVVEAVGENDPPISPAIGQCWIVGSAPEGEWAAYPLALAGYTAGGWRFVAPFAGMEVWSRADGCHARYDGADWRIGSIAGRSVVIDGLQVVGERGDAIADPAGGGVVDAEARVSIAAILAMLRNHGLIAS